MKIPFPYLWDKSHQKIQFSIPNTGGWWWLLKVEEVGNNVVILISAPIFRMAEFSALRMNLDATSAGAKENGRTPMMLRDFIRTVDNISHFTDEFFERGYVPSYREWTHVYDTPYQEAVFNGCQITVIDDNVRDSYPAGWFSSAEHCIMEIVFTNPTPMIELNKITIERFDI